MTTTNFSSLQLPDGEIALDDKTLKKNGAKN